MSKMSAKNSTAKRAKRIKALSPKARMTASTRGGASLGTQKVADGSVRFLPAVQTTIKQ